MIDFVGFDNDLPRSALVVGLDHEPALDDVVLETTGTMQHGAQVDLGEVAVLHAFLERFRVGGDGLAVAEIDIARALETARRSMYYLGDRRPDAYAAVATPAGTTTEMPAHA